MSKEAALIILQGQTMGTDYTVKYIDRADGRALPSPAEVKAQVERRLHAINAEMSTYLPDSTISQFNQLRDDRWFLLPPDFATVLRAAVDLHGITQGGLDVSLGSLVNLWGFGPEPRRDSPPPPDAIAARTSGMALFELAEESGMWFVRKHAPLLQLDLCAIAKGYGVDAVAGVLAASCTDAGSIRSGNRGGSALSIRCSARSMWRWSRWMVSHSPLPAIIGIFLLMTTA